MDIFEGFPTDTTSLFFLSIAAFFFSFATVGVIHDVVIPAIKRQSFKQTFAVIVTSISIAAVISSWLVLTANPKVDLFQLKIITQIGFRMLVILGGVWIATIWFWMFLKIMTNIDVFLNFLTPESPNPSMHQNNLDRPTKSLRK